MDGRGVAVGRATETGEYQLITSERRSLDAEGLKAIDITPRVYGPLIGRWPDRDAEEWLATGGTPTFSEVLALTVRALDQYLELPRPEHRALLATWVVGTSFFPMFLSYPRLSLSGERGCGKSKALTLLAATTWNGYLALTPTPAVLFRLIHEFRLTLLLDECEAFNKEDARDILAIINSGYKAGGAVARVEGKDARRVESFSVYAPMALAAHLAEPLADVTRFAFLSGWRKGEILPLQWDAVDRTAREVWLWTSKNGRRRSLPLTGELWALVEGRWAAREYRTLDGTTALSPFVFHREGESVVDFRKAWGSACIKAGFFRVVRRSAETEEKVPTKLFHDLRRSAVRNMVRAGVPQSVAMEISGHRTAAVFMRYAITAEEQKREALERTEAFLASLTAASAGPQVVPLPVAKAGH
jgi:integrase